jgi:hypothetical protein
MSDFTVTRTLKTPRERVWQVLTQPRLHGGGVLVDLAPMPPSQFAVLPGRRISA